jgi:hypothetical protein
MNQTQPIGIKLQEFKSHEFTAINSRIQSSICYRHPPYTAKIISIYGFPEKELRGLSPNFHIHVSLSDLYITTIGPPTVFSYSRLGRPIVERYKSLTET